MFQSEVADPISIPEQSQRWTSHPLAPITQMEHLDGSLGGWEELREPSGCNLEEETSSIVFIQSHENFFTDTIYQELYLFLHTHTKATDGMPLITINHHSSATLSLEKKTTTLLYMLLRYYKPYIAKITKNTCSKLTGTFIFRTCGIWHLHPNRFTNFSLT